MATGDYLTKPGAAAGVATLGDATTGWVDGATVELIAASSVTTPFAVSHLNVQVDMSVTAADFTYEAIFRVLVNNVEEAIVPWSLRADTLAAYELPWLSVALPEPIECAANASVKVICAAANASNRTFRTKVVIREMAGGAAPPSPRLLGSLGVGT